MFLRLRKCTQNRECRVQYFYFESIVVTFLALQRNQESRKQKVTRKLYKAPITQCFFGWNCRSIEINHMSFTFYAIFKSIFFQLLSWWSTFWTS
eukprot:UN03549